MLNWRCSSRAVTVVEGDIVDAVGVNDNKVVADGFEFVMALFAWHVPKLYPHAEVFQRDTLKMRPCPFLMRNRRVS